MERTAMSEKICDTAMQLFVKKGFYDISVNEICKAVGITKPTFYKYVRTKEDILYQYYSFNPAKMLPEWSSPENGNYWKSIVKGFSMCFSHYISLDTQLLSRLLISQISNNTLSFQSDPQWNEKMMELIEKAQMEKQILSGWEPCQILRMMKSYALGYCFFICTEGMEDHKTVLDTFTLLLSTVAQTSPEFM